MSERRFRSKPEKLLASILDRKDWIVANWLRKKGEEAELGIDLEAEGPQTRRGLTEFLDNFASDEKFKNNEMNIDDPVFLEKICEWAGVETKGEVPDFTGRSNIVIGNYVGKEPGPNVEDPFLEPTIYSLLKLFSVAKRQGIDNVIAVARDTTFDGVDLRLKQAIGSHIAYAHKNPGEDYKLTRTEGLRLLKLVKSGNGLTWLAPAATTDANGLKLENLITTPIRQAMENDANLWTLAMETDETGTKATSIELQRVLLPEVVVNSKLSKSEKKVVLRRINHQILRWSLAQVALVLPEEQRGHFKESEIIQEDVIDLLNGISANSKNEAMVSGGFLGE